MPRTLHYTEDAERVYFIVSRVPGKSIDEAWWDLNENQKEHCATRVAQIYQELSTWTSNSIAGVDENRPFDPWLDVGSGIDTDLRPENLLENCQQMHMDTSTFVFNHNDLGPTNVIVDVGDNCNIGLVDWEMAVFVPFAWVRTKLAACWAGDFNSRKGVDADDISMSEWRRHVAEELGKYNVPDLSEEFQSRFYRERDK